MRWVYLSDSDNTYRYMYPVPQVLGGFGEARFSREMAAERGRHEDPAQARRDSPDPGRRHDGRLHLAAIFPRRAGRRLLEVLLYTQYSTVRAYSAQPMAWSYMHRVEATCMHDGTARGDNRALAAYTR